ncbi:hypothetical protein BDW22DRAFT_246767 [Trametopsis cervina]|nr:hypothetical protein BDW22DRAFT_246767 [Trametopsis cervina]
MTSLVQAMPVFEEATDEETLQVGWCFAWLSSIDSWDEIGNRDDEVRYSIWHAEFKPEESHVPDGFYATLMRIALPETRYWRMKRLQGMDPQEREEAANDIDSYLRKSAAEYSEDNAAGRSMACGEGSGVGAGTADGPGGVDAPSEAEDGRDSGNCTNRADAPGWPEEPGNPGNDSAIVAEGLQPGANVALDLESDGCGLGTDGDNGDEQHEAALEDTAGRDSEAAVLPYTEPPSDVKIDDVNPSCQRRAW